MTDATTVSIQLADATATRRLGAAIAETCVAGTIVLLQGPLGAGKTTLADGVIRALGGGPATSPTFVIAHAHERGRIPIWHLDLYRMDDERQVADLDLAQYVSDSAITLCEWPERAPATWPEDVVTIVLSVEGESRRAVLKAGGPKSSATLEKIAQASHS
jgi:tRNA threonylcarbamoyl adenosine modification protein YjeE